MKRITVAALIVIALLLALALALALVAGGGGNESPPWSMTIEAKCAAPAACPTFPPWDGTPRPTAEATPRPGVPTETPRPQEEPTP